MTLRNWPMARRYTGLRARLLLLVLLAMLPLAALIVRDAARQREAALAAAKTELQSLVQLAAEDLESRIAVAHHLLQAAAEVAAVRNATAPACADFLAGLLKQAPRYNNLILTGTDGNLLCSAIAPGRPVNYADTDYVRRAIESRLPAVGKPTIARITGRAVLPVAWPIAEAGGRVGKVLAAGLRLDWFGERYARAGFLPRRVMLIWDAEGRVLYRYPDAEKLTGTLHPEAALIQAAHGVPAAEVVEVPGLDGIERAYALSRVPALSELGLTLAAGVPKAELAAAADNAMRRNLAVLALLAGAVFAFAWWAAETSIRRPVARLAESSGRLRAGDLKARVPGPYPGGEIGDLMAGFNAAAAAVEAQSENLRRSNRALAMLGACNRALVRATSEPQLLDDVCSLIVERGGYRFAWVGFTEPDQAGDVRPVAQAGMTEDDLTRMRLALSDAERAGDCTGTAIRSGHWCVAHNIPTDPAYAPWREAAAKHGYASSISLPLKFNGEAGAALSLYAADPETFDQQEIALLEQLADDIAYGIQMLRSQGARSQAEEALRKSEEQYRTVVEDQTEVISRFREDGTLIFVNDVYGRFFGKPAGELIGTKWQSVAHAEDRPHVEEHLRMLSPSNPVVVIENRVHAGDGQLHWMQFVNRGFFDRQGRLTETQSVGRDVTERKRTEAALELERSKLAAAFGNVAIGLVICDAQGGDISMNAAALRFHGFTSTDDMLRRVGEYADEWDLQYPDGRIMPYEEWPLVRAIRGDYVHDYETYLHNIKTGFQWTGSYTSAPVCDSAGEVILIIMTLIDITEHKRAEQEIRELNASLEHRVAERTQQLEEASRAKSDFLANMSHELRTPLNAIIGFSEMLKDGILGELDTKQRGFVTDIFDAGTHLLSLINDILDLSKVEAGMLQLETGAVDVAALLKVSTLVVREKALAHRIQLDTQIDPALGAMLADERKFKQIVFNLLSNAVKFTPAGGAVTLSARRCPRAEVAFDEAMPGRLIALPPGEDKEFLAITVEDSGVGIAEQDLPKLFEPFTQVDSSIARDHGGTGLGLSLVRRLAGLHGGTVGVASRPGVGSRFCVWLPYRAAAPAMQAGHTAPAVAAPTRAAPPLALVIEEDDRAADLIAAQLHREGFQVMRAATGEEGLVRAAKRRPQLITLGIFLPAMDGWEFLRHLKADARLADTPVVIISVAEGLERGLALGARRVLQKPFTREELVTALAELIEASRSGGAPARVLVVDDNVKAVELVATLIEREGYQALRAYGGAEAIETVRRARPDLVILDLMMPEVSGFEVARALRASEQTARIPILVLTAKDLTPEERAQLNGAVNAILQKSEFSHDELLAELRRAIAAPKPD